MKILFFYNEDWEKEYFSRKIGGGPNLPQADGQGFEVDFIKGAVQEHPELEDKEAEILSVFVGSKVGADALDRFPNLKLIAVRSTGFDHIDTEAAKRRNIAVSNVPSYGSKTVAEFAFALLLTLSRKIFPAYEQILRKNSFSKKGLQGFDLAGKTVGIVGTGKIGKHFAQIARGFDMNIIAFDVHPDEKFAAEAGVRYVSLDELLSSADIISLHLPYNSQTRHFINQNNISQIKKSAYLINTSRGGVVETAALVEALKNGILAGAGLDVLEAEIYMGDDPKLLEKARAGGESANTILNNQYLINHPNVIVTPHNAFNTTEAVERIFDTTVENIKAFGKGETMNEVG